MAPKCVVNFYEFLRSFAEVSLTILTGQWKIRIHSRKRVVAVILVLESTNFAHTWPALDTVSWKRQVMSWYDLMFFNIVLSSIHFCRQKQSKPLYCGKNNNKPPIWELFIQPIKMVKLGMVSFFFYQNYMSPWWISPRISSQQDPPKKGVAEAVLDAQKAGVKAQRRWSRLWNYDSDDSTNFYRDKREVLDMLNFSKTWQFFGVFLFGLKRMNQSVSKLAYILFVGYHQNYGVMEGVCFARFHQRGFFATLRARRCKTSHVVGKPCVVWVTQDQNNTELHMWLWISMDQYMINKSINSL